MDNRLAPNLPWVDSPFLPKLLETKKLDPELEDIVRRFARDGYVIIDPRIPSKLIDEAVEGIRHRFVPTYHPYYADERRLQDGWWDVPAIRQIAVAERVLEVLRALYQREPIPFQTLNFRVGSEQKTHSDTIHFHSIPNLFLAGAWVALEDVDSNNGPLHYYPQSHKLPIYNMADLGIMASTPDNLYRDYAIYESFVEELMQTTQLERVEIKVERGEALIWSANLFHGGSPIRDQGRTRLSQVTHYFFSDCLYYTPLLTDMAIGRTSLRKIYNILKQEVVVHRYNGHDIVDTEQWPPRLSGCELDLTPKKLFDFEEMARREGRAAATPPSVTDPAEPKSVRRMIRSLIERTIGR